VLVYLCARARVAPLSGTAALVQSVKGKCRWQMPWSQRRPYSSSVAQVYCRSRMLSTRRLLYIGVDSMQNAPKQSSIDDRKRPLETHIGESLKGPLRDPTHSPHLQNSISINTNRLPASPANAYRIPHKAPQQASHARNHASHLNVEPQITSAGYRVPDRRPGCIPTRHERLLAAASG